MCGICGVIDFNTNSDVEVLDKMVSSLHHRGPNDRGSNVYYFNESSVGLGHTRLSILDLSPAGHQPMHFEHLSIVFNGEIYNFNEIKKDLLKVGHIFKSETDTEVILHAFSEWGNNCVSKFIGMFVFAILNKKTLEVTIVRDRAGIKPLFYYWKDGLFLFASELKAFHEHTKFEKKINGNAVHQFMDYGYVPSPYCIFEHCGKLDPGHILTFSITKKSFEIKKYWDVNDYYRLPKLNISYNDAQEEVEKLLISAFEYRMISDVPVGVFLSGGYDSTAVTALLQKKRSEKLKTFTIGFEEGNNEAPFAKEIANYIGTDHTEYYCTTKEAQEIIPDLPFNYDEPFADSSAIPTTLVSKLARESVTVALSADAGDEIFAGYNIYSTFLTNLALISRIPETARGTVGHFSRLGSIITPNIKLKNKLDVLSKILKADKEYTPQILYQSYFTCSRKHINELFNFSTQHQKTSFDNNFKSFKDSLSIALAADYSMYLQNDILTKVDRATMSVSLEGREPFLDHRIIEYAAQLPTEYKYGATKKMILKDIVHKYIPKQLMERPKTGFTVPVYSWLKSDLLFLLDENLNQQSIENSGLFNWTYVQKLKQDFLKDKLYDPTIIWKLLQFQIWYNKWM
ncbi:MAG TPA: asparagine synthase (glutamine-hydrolyzing) [Bacteroidales bacterium]|nr:asparagine synthase (glutamine-hydrolyzing) [Bacteroidales bacterium]